MRHSSAFLRTRPRNRQHCKSVILCDLLKLHYRHLDFAIRPATAPSEESSPTRITRTHYAVGCCFSPSNARDGRQPSRTLWPNRASDALTRIPSKRHRRAIKWCRLEHAGVIFQSSAGANKLPRLPLSRWLGSFALYARVRRELRRATREVTFKPRRGRTLRWRCHAAVELRDVAGQRHFRAVNGMANRWFRH
jgi:hypothetical protein